VRVEPLTGKGLESVRQAEARLNLWEGSVRSSKTVSSLIAWLKFVRASPPGNLLMVGKTERTLKRNVIDPLIEWLGASRCKLITGSGELWLLGRRIYLAGANDERAQEKIRGLTLIGTYVDEVSTMPESFFTMLLSRLSLEGARLYGTTNPDSPAHWLLRDYLQRSSVWLDHAGNLLRFEGEDRLDLARFSFRLADNPYLSRSYIEALSREFTGLWRKRFIEGLWVAAEGAIYDMWDEQRHVIDIVPPITQWLCASVDYGTTNPFHAILLGLGGENDEHGMRRDTLYAVSEWRWDSRQRHRQLTDLEYAQGLREWLNGVRFPGGHLRGPTPQYLVIDPSAASFKVQAHQGGWNVVDGDNAVLDGIRLVSSLLSAGRLKFSRSGCPAVIDEFPSYSWDERAARLGEDKPIKINDHGLDASRYGVTTTRGLWHSRLQLAAAA
jgi:PBSX family phage terminase large subunit